MMRQIQFICGHGFLLVGLAIASAAGCSDAKPERVPISGTVLIDGQPVDRGSVMFVNGQTRPAMSVIDKDGRFQLTCFQPGDGAVLGKHKVKVTVSEGIDEHSMRWFAPKKYADENTSGLEVEVTEPRDDMKIELTWDGGKPFVERW
jgi:hypothetical protein